MQQRRENSGDRRSEVKTDKVDAEILAQLLAADYPPWGVVARCGDQRAAPPGAASGAPRAATHPVEKPGACDLAPQPDSAPSRIAYCSRCP
jgi:hypothetical protein